MTTLYKLTTQDHWTRKDKSNACLWGEGVTHSGTGKGELCGPGYIHAYTHPLLAVLLNPIHADLPDPILWECEGDIALNDHGLKVGCVSLTTLRVVPLPEVTTEQRVRFGILCAKQVYKDPQWTAWADAWLDGSDRSRAAAAVAVAEAWEAAWEAAAAAAWEAAAAAAAAAWEAAAAAEKAAAAAWEAATAKKESIDLITIALEVVK